MISNVRDALVLEEVTDSGSIVDSQKEPLVF